MEETHQHTSMARTSLPERPRILIVRLSAIGDTIHSLPLATALRDTFPDCYIGWLVEKPSAPLIIGNPLIDWVHVLPKGWLKKPALVRDVVGHVKRERFDIAIDPQGLLKSALVPWLAGIKSRIGFTRGVAREFAPLLDNIRVEPVDKHVVKANMGLLSGMGVSVERVPRLVVPPTPQAEVEHINAFLAKPEYENGFHLFGPWTTNQSKNWPLEHFASLAKMLREQHNRPSLALGYGTAERSAVVEVAKTTDGALAEAPELSILGVAELERRATLFVGCDSFPLHLAAGMGCPAVGLFGVTDPERVGPHLELGTSVYHDLTLTTSSRQRKKMTQENMRNLPVRKVYEACRDILLMLEKEPGRDDEQ